MTAAAAMAPVPAAAGTEIAGFRNVAELKGFADVLGDRLLDALHFILGIEETAGDRILQKGFAMFLEIVDFGFLQRQAVVALLLEQVALGNERVILTAGGVIGNESVNFLAQGFDFRLVEDDLAKFFGLLDDNCFFSLSLHKYCGLALSPIID